MEYSWLFFAVLSAVFAALVAVFGKIGLESINANAATMIRAGIMFAVLILIIAFTGEIKEIPSIFSNSKATTYIILSGVAGALSWLFYFIALKLGKVSQVVPIDRLSVVFAIIFAFLLLGENINLKTAIGVALVVVGAVLVVLG